MTMKKIIKRVTTLLAAGAVVLTSGVTTVKADTADWAQLYLDKAEMYLDYASADFNLIYIDDDEIPELVIGDPGFWVSVYTVKDGELLTIMDEWGYGVAGNAGYTYLPKRSYIYNCNTDYAGGVLYESYMKVEDGEINPDIDKRAEYIDTETWEELDQPNFYVGQEKVTKKVYNKTKIKGKFKYISGKYSYKKLVKKLNATV